MLQSHSYKTTNTQPWQTDVTQDHPKETVDYTTPFSLVYSHPPLKKKTETFLSNPLGSLIFF